MPVPSTVTGSSAAGTAITPSLVRTVVPAIVGLLLTRALKHGVHIDTTLATQWTTVGLTAVYYAVVRFLETKLNGHFGWLLGLAKAPAYSKAKAPSPDAPGEVLVADVEPDHGVDGRSAASVRDTPVDGPIGSDALRTYPVGGTDKDTLR